MTDLEGRELGRAEGPPSLVDPRDPVSVVKALRAVVVNAVFYAGVELPAAAVWVGLAGAGRPEVQEPIEEALVEERLARRARVGADAEATLHDAFGEGPGILVIAGTGSVAFARSEDGRIERAGGWGTRLGDEGSGYAVGISALIAVARARDTRGPATALTTILLDALDLDEPEDLVAWVSGAAKSDVAALAPAVAEAARAGDDVALAIVRRAVSELRDTALAALRLGGPWTEAPRVALAGGLVGPDGSLRGEVLHELEEASFVVSPKIVLAERGAARLALDLLAA